MSVTKDLIKKLFNSLNLELTYRSVDKDFPTVYRDIKDAIYATNIGLTACYECELSKCVTVNGFSFSETKWHPFVEALKASEMQKGVRQFENSFLEKYYSTWTPRNAREAFPGFQSAPEILAKYPSYNLHAPWMEANPEHRNILMKRTIEFENRANGAPSLPANSGYGLHGPVSQAKGQIEYLRLLNLFQTIKNVGYKRNKYGDVTAIAIQCQDDYRFCIMHGQHRAAVATALNIHSIPIRITKILYYGEIEHWPQVYRGVWKEDTAKKYVEHLFNFDSRAWAIEKKLTSPSK